MPHPPRSRPWIILTAILALLGLLLAACGGSDSGDDDGDSGGGGDTTGITVAADGAPTPGGSIVMGLEAESDGFNRLVLAAGLFEYNFGDSEFLMLLLVLVTLPFAAARTDDAASAARS